mmetsp:Transcript_31037/g.62593  ORF Transcript_31037/g.62593 Transcript_31037/m.62593 type:complete len:183 (-) Transcript_31037:154-702(-)
MFRQSRSLLLLLVLGALAVCAAEDGEPAPAEQKEGVQEILTRNVNELYGILTKEEAPVTALQKRYKGAAMRAGQGFLVGAVAGKVISFLALSIIKTAVFGGVMFGIAVTCGVGADYERMSDVYKMGEKEANRLMRYLDINKDGNYDMQDLKELWLRVEKVLLKYNLARSLGGIAGMALGLTF